MDVERAGSCRSRYIRFGVDTPGGGSPRAGTGTAPSTRTVVGPQRHQPAGRPRRTVCRRQWCAPGLPGRVGRQRRARGWSSCCTAPVASTGFTVGEVGHGLQNAVDLTGCEQLRRRGLGTEHRLPRRPCSHRPHQSAERRRHAPAPLERHVRVRLAVSRRGTAGHNGVTKSPTRRRAAESAAPRLGLRSA